MPPNIRTVSGDTFVYTKKGEFPIHQLADKTLEIWSGYEWTNATIRLVARAEPVIIVEVILAYILEESDGKYYTEFQQLVCTPNCQFTVKFPANTARIIWDYDDDTLIPADQLQRGMSLKNWITSEEGIIHESLVWGVYNIGERADIYEVETPESDTAVLSGVLVS
jgi:hypothetical protein